MYSICSINPKCISLFAIVKDRDAVEICITIMKRQVQIQKGRQTAHVAMPYWMRDTCNGLTPPPNLEAEIFIQILLAGSAANRIYPM